MTSPSDNSHRAAVSGTTRLPPPALGWRLPAPGEEMKPGAVLSSPETAIGGQRFVLCGLSEAEQREALEAKSREAGLIPLADNLPPVPRKWVGRVVQGDFQLGSAPAYGCSNAELRNWMDDRAVPFLLRRYRKQKGAREKARLELVRLLRERLEPWVKGARNRQDQAAKMADRAMRRYYRNRQKTRRQGVG
jgi:hypothetical protein